MKSLKKKRDTCFLSQQAKSVNNFLQLVPNRRKISQKESTPIRNPPILPIFQTTIDDFDTRRPLRKSILCPLIPATFIQSINLHLYTESPRRFELLTNDL